MRVFSIQDTNGRVVQVHTEDHGNDVPVVGDRGQFSQDGSTDPQTFTVTQAIDLNTFSVTFDTDDAALAVQALTVPFYCVWLSGAANTLNQLVDQIDGANGYLTVAEFIAYHDSRGNSYNASPVESIEYAIVKASDYLDQKYRYKGVKKMSVISNLVDPNLAFIDPYLSPFGVGTIPFLSSSVSAQATEWPRQGVTDNNGNLVLGIPKAIKMACAELANRVLNDTDLQPDYDSDLILNGAIVQSISEEVGPIKTSRSFDTRLGVGSMPSFPHIDRMLAKAGLLMAGGGRTVIR